MQRHAAILFIALATLMFKVGLVQAQSANLEEQAYRIGIKAAQEAQTDPVNAEELIAKRYSEVLELSQDEAVRSRLKTAFQRGYREALAGVLEVPSLSQRQDIRIYDITTCRSVAWGKPVGVSDTFTPDINPIYVWFRHEGIPAGTTITSVWYFLETSAPYKIGEGAVTVTPPSDWGQFNFELAEDKQWPEGNYRVDILIGGKTIGEARFKVKKGSSAESSLPGGLSAETTWRRYVNQEFGYALDVPADATVQKSDESGSLVEVQQAEHDPKYIINIGIDNQNRHKALADIIHLQT